MQTRVSSKGRVVLPERVRRRLGIRAGDALHVEVEGERIVLTAKTPAKYTSEIVEDPLTGWPVLRVVGEDVPVLTSGEVAEILSDFP